MTSSNPFVLPGFGQSGEFATNPVMASMDMMRRAWESLAGSGGIGGLGAPSMAATLSAEDLERRITDLRAVENWLRMNLTVLASTIQGLEVQRATLATFKSFVHNAGAFAGQDAAAAPAAKADAAAAAARKPSDAFAQAQSAAGESAAPLFDADQAVAATQAWWDMLRQQFDSLAAATAASMPAPAPAAAAEASAKPATRKAATQASRAKASAATPAAPKPAARKPRPKAS